MIQIPRDENIILVLRKHWFVLFVEALVFVFLALLPLVVMAIAGSILNLGFNSAIATLGTTAYLIWLVVLWIGFFIFWTDYYLDIWIITDKRIIDIEQKGLFSRTTSALRHDNIQDSTISQPGFISSLLGFGTIQVQSAAADVEIIIPYARSPQRVKELIMNLHDKTLDEAQTVRLAKEDLIALREAADGQPDIEDLFPSHEKRKKSDK